MTVVFRSRRYDAAVVEDEIDNSARAREPTKTRNSTGFSRANAAHRFHHAPLRHYYKHQYRNTQTHREMRQFPLTKTYRVVDADRPSALVRKSHELAELLRTTMD